MAFNSTANVEYQDVEYPLDALIYVELEDKYDAVNKIVGAPESEKDAAKEWLTYNTLIDNGFFASQPTIPEPTLSQVMNAPEEVKPVSATVAPSPEKNGLRAKYYESEKNLLNKKRNL